MTVNQTGLSAHLYTTDATMSTKMPNDQLVCLPPTISRKEFNSDCGSSQNVSTETIRPQVTLRRTSHQRQPVQPYQVTSTSILGQETSDGQCVISLF